MGREGLSEKALFVRDSADPDHGFHVCGHRRRQQSRLSRFGLRRIRTLWLANREWHPNKYPPARAHGVTLFEKWGDGWPGDVGAPSQAKRSSRTRSGKTRTMSYEADSGSGRPDGVGGKGPSPGHRSRVPQHRVNMPSATPSTRTSQASLRVICSDPSTGLSVVQTELEPLVSSQRSWMMKIIAIIGAGPGGACCGQVPEESRLRSRHLRTRRRHRRPVEWRRTL